MRSRIGVVVSLVALSGCATARSEKPVLTAGAVEAIVSACGAVRGALHHDSSALPYADFVIPSDEAPVDDSPTRTVKCIGERLKAYRYATFGIEQDKPAQR